MEEWMNWKGERRFFGNNKVGKIGSNSGTKTHFFFHAKAKQQVARNNIDHIVDEAGFAYEDEKEIVEVFT